MTGTPWAWLAHGPPRGGPYSGGPPSTFSPRLPALGLRCARTVCMDFRGCGVGWDSGPALESSTIHGGESWANTTSFAERNPESTTARVSPLLQPRATASSGTRGSSAHCPRVSFPPGQGSLPGSVKLTLQDPWLPADTALVQPPGEQGSPEWEGDAAGGCFWSGCSEM